MLASITNGLARASLAGWPRARSKAPALAEGCPSRPASRLCGPTAPEPALGRAGRRNKMDKAAASGVRGLQRYPSRDGQGARRRQVPRANGKVGSPRKTIIDLRRCIGAASALLRLSILAYLPRKIAGLLAVLVASSCLAASETQLRAPFADPCAVPPCQRRGSRPSILFQNPEANARRTSKVVRGGRGLYDVIDASEEPRIRRAISRPGRSSWEAVQSAKTNIRTQKQQLLPFANHNIRSSPYVSERPSGKTLRRRLSGDIGRRKGERMRWRLTNNKARTSAVLDADR
ncbi:hypothetical protein KM043_000530 [Ampulex compressa]|nr:hypothetical protein KM043_000530 [Ampulex compressa]